MSRVLVALLLTLSSRTVVAGPKHHELTSSYSYDQYLKDFHKSGSKAGRLLFESRLKEILAHNADSSKSYKKGVNSFTDMESPPLGRSAVPREHFKHAKPLSDPKILALAANPQDLPTSVDWRTADIISPVKNQGNCGSCWAFATTATVEAHVALSTGLLFSLSPEQLVACSTNEGHCGGTGGCEGSVPQLAMDYMIDAGGITEEWTVPYTSNQGVVSNDTCPSAPASDYAVAGITGYVTLPENDAASVMAAVATIGPLAINIAASPWKSYESGVFDDCSYDDMDINHVVSLVGYGTTEDGLDYWLVRNSWSPAWGEAGYIKLLRDPVDSTPCGVDNTPLDGTGCDGGPDVQYPCGQCGAVFDVSYPTGAWSA